ncbi:MAG: hypothetical protein ACJAVO_003075 [Parvibaculaceae bacterium]
MEKTLKRSFVSAGTIALLYLSTALPATAEDTRIADLEQRVIELESEPTLNYGVDGVNLTIYGYIKADLIYDLDSDLGSTIFGLGSLEPGTETGSNFTGQAIQSRLGVRAEFDGATAVLEGDFFGGGGGQFRLRHANLTVGNLLIGRSWTNFMPIESYPSTLDFQGPSGIPFARVAQARYTYEMPNGLGFSTSVEQAASDSSDPALTAAAFYSSERYFVKLAALGTTVSTTGGDVDGWGVNLSGNAQLWEGGSINASYTTGEAVGSYMVFGGDDTFGGAAVETDGITLGISQTSGDWTFGAAYGLRQIDTGAATDTERLETIHLTTNYQIRESTTIGAEYIIGDRELFNDTSVSADRLQVSAKLSF